MAPLQVRRYYYDQNSLVASVQSCLEGGHPIKLILQYTSVLQSIVCAALIQVSVWYIIRSNDGTVALTGIQWP